MTNIEPSLLLLILIVVIGSALVFLFKKQFDNSVVGRDYLMKWYRLETQDEHVKKQYKIYNLKCVVVTAMVIGASIGVSQFVR